MTFSLHQGSGYSHVKSDNTHTINNIHPLAHILDICPLIFSHYALFTVYPTGGRFERKNGQAKMVAWNSFCYMCTNALHSFRSFVHWRAASTVIYLLPKATFTLSIQRITSVSLIPALHLLPPSASFWPFGTHPFFPHPQTISNLSDLVYISNSLSIPALLRTSSFLTLSIRDTLDTNDRTRNNLKISEQIQQC